MQGLKRPADTPLRSTRTPHSHPSRSYPPPMPTPDLETLIRFFEEGIPFNRHLGMKVERVGKDRCVVRIPFQDHFIGDVFRPALHGGVVSTLADTAGGLAVFARVGTVDTRVSTVDLRVDYYAPAAMADLIGEAVVVRLGNRVGVARIHIHQGDPNVLVAEGKGVYNVRSKPFPGLGSILDAEGPDSGA